MCLETLTTASRCCDVVMLLGVSLFQVVVDDAKLGRTCLLYLLVSRACITSTTSADGEQVMLLLFQGSTFIMIECSCPAVMRRRFTPRASQKAHRGCLLKRQSPTMRRLWRSIALFPMYLGHDRPCGCKGCRQASALWYILVPGGTWWNQ